MTFEHINPKSAGGGKAPDNGLLACGPCNWGRGNQPLLDYLKPEARQQAFSRYLRFFVENRVRLRPDAPSNSWFSQALEHLVSPVQSSLKTPLERGQALFEMLGRWEPSFWLGAPFQRIITEDFASEPEKKDFLQRIVAGVKSGLRFAGHRAA